MLHLIPATTAPWALKTIGVLAGVGVVAVAVEAQDVARAPQYTAGEVMMFFGAAGVLVTALGAVIVNVIVALRTGSKIDESLKKTDGLVGQVKEVHTLTNSNLSAVKAELSTATQKIESLLSVVQDLKAERSKADIRTALNTPTPVAHVIPGLPASATDEPVQVELVEGHEVGKELIKPPGAGKP